jgi:hypothetical protein
MYTILVRFNLSKVDGKHKMIQVKDTVTGLVEHHDPAKVQVKLTNCRLVNRRGGARKIYEGANKSVVAWIACSKIEILEHPVVPSNRPVKYNPKDYPNWTDYANQNIDGHIFKSLVSLGNKFFVGA